MNDCRVCGSEGPRAEYCSPECEKIWTRFRAGWRGYLRGDPPPARDADGEGPRLAGWRSAKASLVPWHLAWMDDRIEEAFREWKTVSTAR